MVIVAAIVAVVLGLGFFWLTNNYAHDDAGSLESALTTAGAVKQCDRGDAGRGPDNYSPWYNAIYTVTGDRAAATDLVRKAAQQAGLDLVDKTDSNPLYGQYFQGIASKKSTHNDLKSGEATYSALVYKTRAFVAANDKKYCTTTEQSNPSSSITTVLISVGLPSSR